MPVLPVGTSPSLGGTSVPRELAETPQAPLDQATGPAGRERSPALKPPGSGGDRLRWGRRAMLRRCLRIALLVRAEAKPTRRASFTYISSGQAEHGRPPVSR